MQGLVRQSMLLGSQALPLRRVPDVCLTRPTASAGRNSMADRPQETCVRLRSAVPPVHVHTLRFDGRKLAETCGSVTGKPEVRFP